MKLLKDLFQLIGIITAVSGIIIGMNECVAVELQFHSMLVALLVFFVGCLITWLGSQLPESVRA